MMVVIVYEFQAADITVSEKKTEITPLRTLNKAPPTSQVVIEAAGQMFKHALQLSYLGGLSNETADIMPEMKRGPGLCGRVSI